MSIFTEFLKGLIDGVRGSYDAREHTECPNCGEIMEFQDSDLVGWEKYICHACGMEFYEDDLNDWRNLEDDWLEEHETYGGYDPEEDDPYE